MLPEIAVVIEAGIGHAEAFPRQIGPQAVGRPGTGVRPNVRTTAA